MRWLFLGWRLINRGDFLGQNVAIGIQQCVKHLRIGNRLSSARQLQCGLHLAARQ